MSTDNLVNAKPSQSMAIGSRKDWSGYASAKELLKQLRSFRPQRAASRFVSFSVQLNMGRRLEKQAINREICGLLNTRSGVEKEK